MLSQAFVHPRASSSLAPTQKVIEIDDDDVINESERPKKTLVIGDDDDDEDDDEKTITVHSDEESAEKRTHLTPPNDSESGDVHDLIVNHDGYQHASQIHAADDDTGSFAFHDDQDLPDERDDLFHKTTSTRNGRNGNLPLPELPVGADDELSLSDIDIEFQPASQLNSGVDITREIEELIDKNTRTGHQYRSTQSPEPSQDDAGAAQTLGSTSIIDSFDILPGDLDVVENIEEGHYGRVSRAIWHGGTVVAVKVMKEFATTYTQLRRAVEQLTRLHDAGDNANDSVVRNLEHKRDRLVDNASDMRKSFRREAEMLCRLRHPNVVLFVGACSELPDLMLVTEFVARGSLFHVLHRTSVVLDYAAKLHMALGAACGVQYLHRCGILHRDLKSHNLLVSGDNTIKVSDFGLARFSRSFADGRDRQRFSVLDVRIQAPEVLRSSRKEYTVKSDVYSFALLLWELAERREPFRGIDPTQLAISVDKNRHRPTLPDSVRAEYSTLIERCWNHNPTDRPTFEQIVPLLSREKEIADKALRPV